MNRRLGVIAAILIVGLPAGARSADRLQFWNLTGTTITKLYLAPPGTANWGPDQCANDKDGSVDPDERLRLAGVTPGQYDVKLTDANGRTCLVKGVTLQGGKAYAFSLSEAELTDCSK